MTLHELVCYRSAVCICGLGAFETIGLIAPWDWIHIEGKWSDMLVLALVAILPVR